MIVPARTEKLRVRRAAVAAELAILLPFLGFFLIITVDFGRAFYSYLTITNCALSGALYASSDSTHAADTATIAQYAQADGTNLSPLPTVSSTAVTDSLGYPCVDVKVMYTFRSFAGSFPGVPSTVNMSRTVRMRVVQAAPD